MLYYQTSVYFSDKGSIVEITIVEDLIYSGGNVDSDSEKNKSSTLFSTVKTILNGASRWKWKNGSALF